jgi:hypothetical protein
MEPSLASEFPLDNPLIGSGSAWVPASPRGRALPTRRAMVLITPYLLMPEGAVPPPGCVPAPVETAAAALVDVTPKAESVASDAFDGFVQALAQSLLASGQTRAAAALPALLGDGRLHCELPAEALETLRKRGMLEPTGLEATASFRATATAWRDVLCGVKEDLSDCGASTLDTWSAELLCALSAAPKARSNEYRRELRKRGVAAFGLLAA